MENYKNMAIFILLYFSLIIGFYFDENLNFGSYNDWLAGNLPAILDFSNNFQKTFINYENYGHRHSPVYLIFLSLFLKSGIDIDIVRLIHLHLCLILIFIFYKCLLLKFKDINKSTLQILSFVVFLSPTFRSLSIWPDSRLPGLTLFIFSVYYLLKFINKSDIKYAWYSSTLLILSSYISPNFSIFALYFYFFYFKKLNFLEFTKIIFLSFIASLPMMYYLFILDINFFTAGNTPGFDGKSINLNFNFANKILIIPSIILFHLLPILIFLISIDELKLLIKKNILIISIITIILFYFFNYQLSFTGGGIFFQLSQYLLGNNYIFLFISFASITLIFYFFEKSVQNLFIIFILILSNIQNTIYHKYYEPMVFIIFFSLLQNLDLKKYFRNNYSILITYFFSLFYISLRIFKNHYLT